MANGRQTPAARVQCIGACGLDIIMRVGRLPAAPTKILTDQAVTIGAGMATSAAATVARLGGEAGIWGRLGRDPAGGQYLADLAREGVETAEMRRIAGRATTVSTILVDDAGERLIVAYYDPAMEADPDWLPLETLRRRDAVMADIRWPEGAARALAAIRALGRIGVLDGDIGPAAVLHRLAPLASHAIFSEEGLSRFSPAGDVETALHRADRALPGLAGVTLGAAGFAWVEDGAVQRVAAPPVRAVDTLAAGDVFHGAFALALVEGMPVAHAGRFACAAAAIKCTRFGGRLGAPGRDEVEAALRRGW